MLLGRLATHVADVVSQLEIELETYVIDLENNDKRRHAVVHMISTVVDQSESAVALFTEIRDRADLGLPSVSTISEDTLQAFIKNTTQTRPDLRPIYPKVRSYFKLPYAETSVNIKKQRFTTVLRIPFVRKVEHFYRNQSHLAYTKMTSENNHVYLSHQETVDCHKTSTDVVCLTRPCRVNKYEDALKSCIVTRSKTNTDDIVEIIYDPEYLQKNPVNEKIIVNCEGGRRKELPVSLDVIQISLPQSCSVHNQFFEIEKVITSEIPPKYLQDNELTLSFTEASLNVTEEDFASSFTIKSPATVQIVEQLRQDAKYAKLLEEANRQHAEEAKKANQKFDDFAHNSTYSVFGILAGGVILVLVLFCCLYFQCQLCKQCLTC